MQIYKFFKYLVIIFICQKLYLYLQLENQLYMFKKLHFHYVFLVVLMFCAVDGALAQKSNKKTSENIGDYSMECVGMTNNDDYIVNVTATAKTLEAAKGKAVEYAVQGVLFKGFQANGNGSRKQKALVTDTAVIARNTEYFANLLTLPEYSKYAETLNNAPAAPVKVKGGFRVTQTIIVHKDALRKRLENDSIIKSLSSVLENR